MKSMPARWEKLKNEQISRSGEYDGYEGVLWGQGWEGLDLRVNIENYFLIWKK